MEAILKELKSTISHIPLHERQSVWYREYLHRVYLDMLKEVS